jgi:DNA-binding CsgD family transcriptional regulator
VGADYRTNDDSEGGTVTLSGSETAWGREMTMMENRVNETRVQTQDGVREQDPERAGGGSDAPRSGEDDWFARAAASRSTRAQSSIPRRDVASWVNWQSTLYLFVLGLVCVLLVPLTSLWWLVLVCGTAVPIALTTLDRTGLIARRPDDKKAKERELLRTLVERGELTPTVAAMRTSLTVDEASKMLEELARKGHLKPRAEDGVMAYALGERDRREIPTSVSAPSEEETESAGAKRRLGAAQQLDDPLSEREMEVLSLLSSGRTNSEVARDLFVSVGTVKSHTGNIYRKLGAKNRAEAIGRARQLELLP